MESEGLSLECMLAHREINLLFIKNCVNILNNYDFSLRKSEEVVIYTGEFETLNYNKFIDEYLRFTKKHSINSIIINLEGELIDVPINLSLTFDLNSKVTTIDIPLSIILPGNLNFENQCLKRFFLFAHICRDICKDTPPKFVFIGEESFLSEDFEVQKLEKQGDIPPFNEVFFSKKNLDEIFNSLIEVQE